jgi:SAM-dependent methyltransferase
MSGAPPKQNSKEWWEQRYQGRNPLYGKEPSAFLSEGLAYLSKGETLDIACGEGRNTAYLAMKGFAVTGLDWSETALARARELAAASGAKAEFKAQDLEFFLLPILRYSTIVLVDYHPTPSLLKNLARGLAKGGTLLVDAYQIEQIRRAPERLEPFECFRPGELLGALSDVHVLYYDERFQPQGEARVRCLARKSAR